MNSVTRGAEVRQFGRFAAVGILSNLGLFGMYLLFTGFGAAPVPAATLTWAIGVATTFTLNRTWTFRHEGALTPALVRYGALYAAAYLLNVILLQLFIDHSAVPHEWVQGALIILFAIGIFAAQRSWVFRKVPEG